MTLVELPTMLPVLHRFFHPKARGAARRTVAPVLSSRDLAEAMRDTGLPPEDLLGEAPDEAQPFFLRPGFGAARR